jgi:anti-sigma B factor antagonist
MPQDDGFRIMMSEADGMAVVHAAGEIDLDARAELVRILTQASAGGRNVEVDLSRTTFIDSTGLRALLAVWRSQTAAGRGFALRNPSAQVRQTLRFAGLEDTFPIAPSDPE